VELIRFCMARAFALLALGAHRGTPALHACCAAHASKNQNEKAAISQYLQ